MERYLDIESYSYSEVRNAIRLHLNECLFPPPDEVLNAIVNSIKGVNFYPNVDMFNRFRTLLAEYAKVDIDNVYPFTGADSALRAIYFMLTEPGNSVLYIEPTFSMVKIYARIRRLNEIIIGSYPMGEWWRVDIEQLIEKSRDADLVIIVDPNNPTGSPILYGDKNLISTLCESTKGFIVIDETYYEFSGYTAAPLVNIYPNLIVVRSLSKAFCLAGLRLGYVIANKKIINVLSKPFTPFDIPTPSIAAGIAALENRGYVDRVVNMIKTLREYMFNELRRLGIEVYRSLTNFLLIRDKRDLRSMFMRHGIAIKSLGNDLYRITIGSEETCRKIIDILRGIQ
ncbi:aminotransferase class I and II [Ignisphaera aggregans DSM 17230]|uniref:Aminotransferase class I and II n=1 Tax=Ignisphaera aggregans (strain DSM 17230 / JCM 13409 / AQ1.S1) TaxID=583356 RepID=E0SRC7_IGNAA|nr:aminotransferase class I and II [Ignisphaera aggregans DSM 17230]